jgi:hypothetical protein
MGEIIEKRKEFKESRIAIKLEARSCMEQDVPIRRGKERDLTICLAITHMRENNLKRYFFFLFFSSLDKRYPSSSTTRRLEHQQTENEMNIHTHSKEEKNSLTQPSTHTGDVDMSTAIRFGRRH